LLALLTTLFFVSTTKGTMGCMYHVNVIRDVCLQLKELEPYKVAGKFTVIKTLIVLAKILGLFFVAFFPSLDLENTNSISGRANGQIWSNFVACVVTGLLGVMSVRVFPVEDCESNAMKEDTPDDTRVTFAEARDDVRLIPHLSTADRSGAIDLIGLTPKPEPSTLTEPKPYPKSNLTCTLTLILSAPLSPHPECHCSSKMHIASHEYSCTPNKKIKVNTVLGSTKPICWKREGGANLRQKCPSLNAYKHNNWGVLTMVTLLRGFLDFRQYCLLCMCYFYFVRKIPFFVARILHSAYFFLMLTLEVAMSPLYLIFLIYLFTSKFPTLLICIVDESILEKVY
jgi:hypothetical protein